MINAIVGMAAVLAALFGIHIGQRMGWWQLQLGRKVHDLNVRRSLPKIGVEARIEERHVNPTAFPPFYYLRVVIYNAGEFPARQLKGYCELSCPDNSVKQFTIPIIRDFLDSARPYELEPYRIEGTTLWNAMRGETNQVRFNVNIEFDYFGLLSDKPEHHSATYRFQHNSPHLVKD